MVKDNTSETHPWVLYSVEEPTAKPEMPLKTRAMFDSRTGEYVLLDEEVDASHG